MQARLLLLNANGVQFVFAIFYIHIPFLDLGTFQAEIKFFSYFVLRNYLQTIEYRTSKFDYRNK